MERKSLTKRPKSVVFKDDTDTESVREYDREVREAAADSPAIVARNDSMMSDTPSQSGRSSASTRAYGLVNTPASGTVTVHVHQFYPNIDSDYKVEPGLLFYDEDTEDEEEEEEVDSRKILQQEVKALHIQTLEKDDSAGRSSGVASTPQHILSSRPDSQMTDVTTVTADGEGGEPGSTSRVLLERKMSGPSEMLDKQKMLPVPAEEDEELMNDGDKRGSEPFTFTTAVDEQILEDAMERQAERQREKMATMSLVESIIYKRTSELHTKAVSCMRQGDYEEAIRLLSKLIGMSSGSPTVYALRAECHVQMADFKSAILNYRRAMSGSMDYPDGLDGHESPGGRSEAGEDGAARSPCGSAGKAAGSSSGSIGSWHDRLALLYFFQGQCLFDQQCYNEALDSFSLAVQMRPDNAGYHARIIACLASLQKHDDCLLLINKRLTEEQTNPDLYVMRARLQRIFKNVVRCYNDVISALEIDRGHQEALSMKEEMHLEAERFYREAVRFNLQGRLRDALQKVSAAVEYNPTRPEFHIIRGALNRKLGDFNRAVDDFLQALDKTDHNELSSTYQEGQRQLLLTYNDFAVECFKQGHYSEAIILLNKSIRGEKREKGLYINRGDCFFYEKDFAFALADYHQALEFDQSDTAVRSRISLIHNEHGIVEYQSKQYREADLSFSKAIQFNTAVPQYYVSRARARYTMENTGGARQDLIIALLLSPQSEECSSLVSRLFPGKSLMEIVSSRAAQNIRECMPQLPFAPLDGVTGGDWKPQQDARSTEKQGGGITEGASAADHTEVLLLSQKKQIGDKVQMILQDPIQLRFSGPRIQPLHVPAEASPSTGWRKFRMGIGQ